MPTLRKQRTRTHIIEALSINHIEYHFLREGWSIIRHQPDYGIDLQVHLFSKEGYVEPEFFFVQIKSTDSFKANYDKTHTFLDINIEDINLWSNILEPVLLILYDAQKELAYWLHFQEYFKANLANKNIQRQIYHRVHIPISQVIDMNNCADINNLVRKVYVTMKE